MLFFRQTALYEQEKQLREMQVHMLNTLHNQVRELQEWKKNQQLQATTTSSSLLHHQSASLPETAVQHYQPHHPDLRQSSTAPSVLSAAASATDTMLSAVEEENLARIRWVLSLPATTTLDETFYSFPTVFTNFFFVSFDVFELENRVHFLCI